MSTQDNINEIAKIIQKAMTAQEAASRGLVPQSGNPDKPGRWIKDPKADDKSKAKDTLGGESPIARDELGRRTNITADVIRDTADMFESLTDRNEHGLAAKVVVSTYGTKAESDIIDAINTAHWSSSTGIDRADQRIRDAIVSKYESQLNQDPDKGSSEPKSPNESIDMSDSWGRDSDPLSPNIKDFALPLNPNKTIDGKKYRVRGVRDSEKGQEAVIWADNQSYLIRKPKNGKWSKPIKTN